MAKYTGPACKLCRREGEKLFLKGERCYTPKCAFDRRSFAPGQHGRSGGRGGRSGGAAGRESDYGKQIAHRDKIRTYYLQQSVTVHLRLVCPGLPLSFHVEMPFTSSLGALQSTCYFKPSGCRCRYWQFLGSLQVSDRYASNCFDRPQHEFP